MQPFSRSIGQGPPQSNGMCLAEFSVYSNLKPCASTDRIVDFPQVTSCEPAHANRARAFRRRTGSHLGGIGLDLVTPFD
jgi:hypothetical protein